MKEAKHAEKSGLAAAEAEAERIRAGTVARGEADAEAEHLAKLRVAEEKFRATEARLLQEKQTKLDQLVSLANLAAVETVKQAAESLKHERDQSTAQLEASVEEILRKQLEEKERT